MGPAVSGLFVEQPILLCNMVGIEDTALRFKRVAIWKVIADKGGVNRTVDD